MTQLQQASVRTCQSSTFASGQVIPHSPSDRRRSDNGNRQGNQENDEHAHRPDELKQAAAVPGIFRAPGQHKETGLVTARISLRSF
jgi:hypothetical protein